MYLEKRVRISWMKIDSSIENEVYHFQPSSQHKNIQNIFYNLFYSMIITHTSENTNNFVEEKIWQPQLFICQAMLESAKNEPIIPANSAHKRVVIIFMVHACRLFCVHNIYDTLHSEYNIQSRWLTKSIGLIKIYNGHLTYSIYFVTIA